ncbi:phage head closure protein [Aliarcobacter lanthieri]|uniref:phage head closure protein n=1 Tax=Aliarcobacter lanthieri TaxID=1355374 RepID=UPI003AAF317C
MSIRAGRLRYKGMLQKIGDTQDEFGSVVEGDYQDFKNVWFDMYPVSGNEKFLGNADFSKVTHRIKIRYIPDIDASMRLVWKDKIFNFIYPRNKDGRFKEIEIYAYEVVNGNNS